MLFDTDVVIKRSRRMGDVLQTPMRRYTDTFPTEPLPGAKMNPTQNPHRRYNALTGDWILVSPHRTQRPWQGKQELTAPDAPPPTDSKNFFLLTETRGGGARHNQC